MVSTENVCVHNCRPVTSWWQRHPEQTPRAGSYKYVNSGFMMGTREALMEALEYIMASGHTDDQYALCEYLNQYPERGALDTESKLMGTITMVGTDFTRPPGRLTRKSTQAQPYFLHSPGIRWDLGRRYNSWGQYLLGEEFQPYAAKEDMLSNSNWRFGLAVSVWILLMLFYLCPPFGGVVPRSASCLCDGMLLELSGA